MEETNAGSCLINFILGPVIGFCLSSLSWPGRKFGRPKNSTIKAFLPVASALEAAMLGVIPPAGKKGFLPALGEERWWGYPLTSLKLCGYRCCASSVLCLLLIAWDFSEETHWLLHNSQVSKPLSLLLKYIPFKGTNRFCFKKMHPRKVFPWPMEISARKRILFFYFYAYLSLPNTLYFLSHWWKTYMISSHPEMIWYSTINFAWANGSLQKNTAKLSF